MIKLNDTGLIVQYIQNFLKDNYNKNVHLSDVYDIETHQTLIDYLKLPEILDCYKLKDLLIQKFTMREQEPPHKLINGGGIWNFDFEIVPDTIKFFSRDISQCLSGATQFISEYIEDVKDLCRENGWYVSNYTSFVYNSDSNQRIEILIRKESRKQLLPSKDIIKMINLSTNEYMLNKCFIDENNSFHGIIEDSNFYKIALIPAKPGDSFTLAHGYNHSCEMAIAYSEDTKENIKENGTLVENIESHLSKSVNGEVNEQDFIVYKIPEDSDCKYLLIQMPFKRNLINGGSKKVKIKIGDINGDGVVDKADYVILKNYIEKIAKDETPPTLSKRQLIAANINKDTDIKGNPIVNEMDLKQFEAGISRGDLNFGEIEYTELDDLVESDYDKLLVMYGDVMIDNLDNQLNIPIRQFQSDPWLIHDSFLPFILGSAIHKYSNIEDILWLQNKIKEVDSDYSEMRSGYYDSPEDYLLNESLVWNENKTCYEYYKNNVYTGYILDNKTDILNGRLIKESNLEISPIIITNGRWTHNGEWAGRIVLKDGQIVKEISKNSLKERVKEFQIKNNKYYKYQTDELVTFITGYVDPLTEKWLTQ